MQIKYKFKIIFYNLYIYYIVFIYYIVYNNYDNESEKQIIELVKKMLIEEQKGKIYAKNVFWTRWGF